MKVILASGSPRRRELMEMLGIRCKVQASGAEEVVTSAEPEKVVEELSRLKCLDVADACCCFGLERSDEKQQYPLQTSLCIFNLIREALCFNGEKQ